MPVTSKTAFEIASLCSGFHKSSDGYRAKCPAHNGSNPESLHIWEKGGNTYLKCHSQDCKPNDILKAIGIKPDQPSRENRGETTYDYVDEEGNLIYQAVRYYQGGEKRFYQRRPDPSNPGAYLNNLEGVTRVLYRLPRVRDAVRDEKTILILEGEKDVHTAEALGFVATTNVGGAEKWRPEYCEVLKGADLVIIPDDDDPGRKHAAQIKRSFRNVDVKSLIDIKLPGLERGGDLTDWVHMGGTKEQLQALIDETRATKTLEAISTPTLEFPLQLNDKGYAKETFYNMSMILQHDPEWCQKLRFDSFLNVSMLDGSPISEVTEMRIAERLGEKYQFGGNNPKVLSRAIHAASSSSTYDSLQEWITKLPPWDEKGRLRTWMVECCGAIENALTGWISYVSIMQMVARAMTPGCMARLVPVWEGPEDKGKTSAIMILGDPWSMTFDQSMDTKEAHMAIQSCWVAELSELDTLRKTTETRLKSFISQVKDSYVPKYSNYRVDHPRRTVFFGTTNEDNYLPGQTGNTRWLPVRTESFDLDKLRACRDQLFAEALAIFEVTPDVEWWQPPSKIQNELADERDQRRMLNVYEDDLRTWLKVWPHSYVTWPDIASGYLGLDGKKDWSNWVVQRQIGDALTILGWKRGQRPRSEGRKKCWNRPDDEGALS